MSRGAKNRAKWQTIQWLITHKRHKINKLCTCNTKSLKRILNYKDGIINRNQFDKFLRSIGIKNDQVFSDKLFYVFDTIGNN